MCFSVYLWCVCSGYVFCVYICGVYMIFVCMCTVSIFVCTYLWCVYEHSTYCVLCLHGHVYDCICVYGIYVYMQCDVCDVYACGMCVIHMCSTYLCVVWVVCVSV
jgi:hypothetical protein